MNHFTDERGSLFPLEFSSLPFTPKRLFYVTNVPKGMKRGGHAHLETRQLAVCIQGEIVVSLSDGLYWNHHVLNEGESVLIDKMVWDEEIFCTGNDILLCLCSTEYNRKDYIENMDTFIKLKREQ